MASAAVTAVLPASLARNGFCTASSHLVARNSAQARACLGAPSKLLSLSVHSGLRQLSRSSSQITTKHRQPALRTTRRGYEVMPITADWKQEILWTDAKIAETNKAAEQLFSITVDISSIPELKAGHTKAGQFVQMKINDSKPAFLAIASPPKVAESGALEFLIKDVEGTTANLICRLSKGDKVEISQVMGKGFPVDRLTPPEEFPTVVLLATGSGISPVRSLIEAGFAADKRSDVRLYYGADNLGAMAYQDRFDAWEASGVKVIPVLSQAGDDWAGSTGYVQHAFLKDADIKDGVKAGAVLCGQKEMAQEATTILLEAGLSKDNILLNF
eukprot:jgi/Mesen1/3196/ME000185S02337